MRPGGGEQLRYKPGHRQRYADLACSRQDDAQVLVVQVNPKPRRELTAKHPCGLKLQHPAPGQPSANPATAA